MPGSAVYVVGRREGRADAPVTGTPLELIARHRARHRVVLLHTHRPRSSTYHHRHAPHRSNLDAALNATIRWPVSGLVV